MRWNSQKVNQILEQYKSDSSLKPIVRDITIDHILSDSSEELQFPFLISPAEIVVCAKSFSGVIPPQ